MGWEVARHNTFSGRGTSTRHHESASKRPACRRPSLPPRHSESPITFLTGQARASSKGLVRVYYAFLKAPAVYVSLVQGAGLAVDAGRSARTTADECGRTARTTSRLHPRSETSELPRELPRSHGVTAATQQQLPRMVVCSSPSLATVYDRPPFLAADWGESLAGRRYPAAPRLACCCSRRLLSWRSPSRQMRCGLHSVSRPPRAQEDCSTVPGVIWPHTSLDDQSPAESQRSYRKQQVPSANVRR